MEVLTGGAATLAGEAGKSSLKKLKQHLDYLLHYRSNIAELGNKQNELKEKMDEANLNKANADKKFQEFFPRVLRWQKETQELHQKVQEFLDENNEASHYCLKGCCRNPWSCYSSGKKAWKITEGVNDKIKEAPDFGVAYYTRPPTLECTFNLDGVKEFVSRQSLIDKVLEVLRGDKESMISICGIGGVGKTTMAKLLLKKVQEEGLFDETVMTTVTQNPNLETIQGEILELLGFKTEDRTLLKRATQLADWFNHGKRTLVILDDVWEQLNLEAIGLSVATKSKGCKIVLTSRNENVCKKMGSERNFPISLLTKMEAWDLFREIAGKSIEELDLDETARAIANECGRLPIAIATVANALRDEPRSVWDDSLLHLQNSNIQGIRGMGKVYSGIQLSYDLLKDKEAQLCFLLCCLYPEDFDVPIEDLVIYGVGLELFQNVANLKQARDRVCSIIHKLKKSSLLLDSEKEECVKMHDLVRDFAISITSKENDSFVVGCEAIMEKWPKTNKYKNCRAISLVCNEINEHPIEFECPNLELLQIVSRNYSARFPIDFFQRMNKLKVVSLDIPSLLESLDVLKELKTLRVKETGYRWKETSKVGGLLRNLTNLEILSISTNGRFNDFPREIGQLSNLRLLDFSGTGLAYIPQGVLSQMVKLEELYLPRNFTRWGCEDRKRTNASLREIECLRLITALQIGLQKDSILSENLVKNLKRFNVYMGSYYSPDCASLEESKEMFEVFDVDACDIEGSWISDLLRKSNYLRLMQVRNLKNIMYHLKVNGFRQMKKIYISDCHELHYLIDAPTINVFSQLKSLFLHHLSSLKEIWCAENLPKIKEDDQEIQLPGFNNLDQISIVGCQKLKYVFPLSMARGMRNLRSIDIRSCDEMEVVFYHANEDNTATQSSTSKDGATASERKSSFNKSRIVPPNDTSGADDNKHTCPTPNSIIGRLLRKEKLPKTVSNKQMEEIVSKENEKKIETIAFPQLQMLKLVKLPNLRAFCDASHTIELHSLESVEIYSCDNLNTFSKGLLSHPLLKEIQINKGSYSVMEDLNAVMKERPKYEVNVQLDLITEDQ